MNNFTFIPLLCELLAKSTLVILAAALAVFAWRGASAARRHIVWCAALCVIFLLPLTLAIQPRWSVPPVRVITTAAPLTVVSPKKLPIAETSTASDTGTVSVRKWQLPVMVVWAIGAGLILLQRVFGSARLLWLRVSLRNCTWGTVHPVIMLPLQWLDSNDARLNIALRHEAAHIARGDHFTSWIAQITCALYWPNPLVWLAARALRIAQEQAADDLVMSAGTAPGQY
ncbi:MAG: M56 family metallopeptidase [Verrucomicrobiota bacterium]